MSSLNAVFYDAFMAPLEALGFARNGLPLTIVNPAFPFGARDVAPTPRQKKNSAWN